MSRIAKTWVVFLAVVAAPLPALGQQADSAAAETLFQEGKRLMDAKDYEHACPKLAASLRVDPGAGGTMMLLAYCHELQGKTATAWAEFTDARAQARRDGRADRETAASEHIASLQPKLSRLSLQPTAATASLPGITITRDGTVVPREAYGDAIPVDPGEHTIAASAPGRVPWRTTVTVSGAGESRLVPIPDLVPSTSGSSTPTTAAPAPSHGSRTAGWVVGGIGVAALGVGAFFGIEALSKHSSAETACPDSRCSAPGSYDVVSQGKTDALLADAGIGIGVVGVAVGAYLLATSRSGKESAWNVAPVIGANGGGVAAGGAF